MKHLRLSFAFLITGLFALLPDIEANTQENLFCVNAYPSKIQARLEALQRTQSRAAGSDHALRLVIEKDKAWRKEPVTVSFFGGDTNLHKQVVEAMDDWEDFSGVKLDFGYDATTDKYRHWSPSDTSFKSDIRISFDHPEGGYWSLVGIDSSDPSIVDPGEASLNLQDFAGTLTENQRGTARHEMGHALGFHHEHQSPASGCDQEFRWEDGPDGTPGIYAVLGGDPNYWPRWKVDHNLRQLKNSRKLIVTPYDSSSIMHYSFPKWMFVSGAASPCLTDRNNNLSDGDKEGIKEIYPMDKEEVAKRRQMRVNALEALLESKSLDDKFKKEVSTQLESIRNIKY